MYDDQLPRPGFGATFRRWWWLMPVVSVLLALAGIAAGNMMGSKLPPAAYEYRLTMQAGEVPPLLAKKNLPEERLAQFKELLKSPECIGQAITALGLDKKWGVKPDEAIHRAGAMVRTSTIAATQRIEVRVTGTDAGEAKELGDEVAKAAADLNLAEAKAAVAKIAETAREIAENQDTAVEFARAEMEASAKAAAENAGDLKERYDLEVQRQADLKEKQTTLAAASEPLTPPTVLAGGDKAAVPLPVDTLPLARKFAWAAALAGLVISLPLIWLAGLISSRRTR